MVDLHHQVPINASPAKVYAAIATSEGNRGWWTADSTVDSKIGGDATFGFDQRGTVFHMTINKLSDREVVMSCRGDPAEWNGTTLAWRIEGAGNQTTPLQLEVHDRLLRLVQLDVGTLDVPPQGLCGDWQASAAVEGVTEIMPDILHRVGIDAKPERVFAVLTTIRRRAPLVAKQADRQRGRRRTNSALSRATSSVRNRRSYIASGRTRSSHRARIFP